jgi:bifunctional UDP-N-acetylglucosamine pyrophosphorylase/glucosamine-1-phosphate N-acetyltransferase
MAIKKIPVYAVIMAAGQGKRINAQDIPKVLYPVCGRPMLRYVYDAVKNIADEVIIITGYQGQKVEAEMNGQKAKFAHQAERLGTAHAVRQAEKLLKGKEGIVLIANGDGPLFTESTFRKLIGDVAGNNYVLAINSAVEDDHPAYGRVLRDEQQKVIGIREAKDASPTELKIREKNPGIYAVKNDWLWPALAKIKKSKVTGEYYITDLVEIAIVEGRRVEAIPMKNPREIKGINTLEELHEVEEILGCKNK